MARWHSESCPLCFVGEPRSMVSAHASPSRLCTRHLSAVLGWNENIDVVSLAPAHRAADGQIGGQLAGCAVGTGYSCWIIHNKVLRNLRGMLPLWASQGEELNTCHGNGAQLLHREDHLSAQHPAEQLKPCPSVQSTFENLTT